MPKPFRLIAQFISERDALVCCKRYLAYEQNLGRLLFRRIHVQAVRHRVGGREFFRHNTDMIGMADLMVFLPGGRTLHVEVKSIHGIMQSSQWEWKKKLEDFGHRYVIIRSAIELQQILEPLLTSS